MIENFQALIGAKIKDFQRKMKMVDKKVKETAMEATKPINADINDFYASILEVESLTKKAVKKATKEINVDINDFYTQLAEMEAETKKATKPSKKNIGADISNFMRKASQVAVVARNLVRDKVVVTITAKYSDYQNAMSKYATMTRALGEVMQNTFQGVGVTLSAGLIPLIAVLGGTIGNLGPMLGVVAGSTFALASAFAVAGIGAVAFGGLAATNLKGVFEESKKAKDAMDALKGSWSQIAKETKAQTVSIFIKVLNILNGALLDIKPMFLSVTEAVSRLTDSLGRAFDSKPMQAFFEYLNQSAGPLLETVTKGIGNFILGILNMITAFAPLTETTAKGFEAMGASFATWAAGLSESKSFQNFVTYVQENMPKIRSIFSDAFQGIINTFAAFGPSSADMMTSLQNMMERFKEWSSALGESQGFKNFINYIKENGPKVVDLIGNITMFLVNLGIALAPLGSSILDLVNNFLAWSSSMLENHPIIGKIVAVMLVLTGNLIALAPHIIAFGTLFGGASTAVMAATALMRAKFVTGMGMMITSMLATAKQMVVTSAQFVAKWALIGAQSLFHAGKVVAAWALSTGKAMATALVSMLATSATFVAKWLWMGVQALAQAARMAAAWFIALGPVGWVIGAIVGLAILIIANWDKIKASTIKIWTSVSNAVKDAWEKVKTKTVEAVVAVGVQIAKMPGKVREFVGDMVSAGAALIDGVIQGITGKIGEGLSAIGGFAKGLLARFKSDTDTHSPSRAFENISKWFAPGIVKGIDKTSHLAINSVSDMASRLTNAFTPQLALPMTDLQMSPLDTSTQMDTLKRQIKQELSVDMQVNHKGQSGISNENGGAGYGPVYVTIDAKNVKEFNDVIRIFDQQVWDSN